MPHGKELKLKVGGEEDPAELTEPRGSSREAPGRRKTVREIARNLKIPRSTIARAVSPKGGARDGVRTPADPGLSRGAARGVLPGREG